MEKKGFDLFKWSNPFRFLPQSVGWSQTAVSIYVTDYIIYKLFGALSLNKWNQHSNRIHNHNRGLSPLSILNPSTGVVISVFIFWSKPQLWSVSFFLFGQNHKCGFAAFHKLSLDTGTVVHLFPGLPQSKMHFHQPKHGNSLKMIDFFIFNIAAIVIYWK